MNQFAVRGIAVYCALSGAILSLDGYMRGSGFAHRYNPAWLLIHPLYQVFALSWLIIILCGVVVAVFVGVTEFFGFFEKRKLRLQEELHRIQEEQFRITANANFRREQRRIEILARRQKLKQEREALRKQKRHREYLRQRTPADAVDDALNEFT